jgi:HEAT repeat protein
MLLNRIRTTDEFSKTELSYSELHVRLLESEDEQSRLLAANKLVMLGEVAVEPLISALRKRHDHVWTLAASVLVKIGAPAVGPLIDALYDEDEQVRILAVGALGRIGSARAIQPLIHMVRQEDEHVRELIIWALVRIGTPAVGPLIVALRDSAACVQAAAARALGAIGDPRATAPLMALQTTDNAVVREVIAEVLARMGHAQVAV